MATFGTEASRALASERREFVAALVSGERAFVGGGLNGARGERGAFAVAVAKHLFGAVAVARLAAALSARNSLFSSTFLDAFRYLFWRP